MRTCRPRCRAAGVGGQRLHGGRHRWQHQAGADHRRQAGRVHAGQHRARECACAATLHASMRARRTATLRACARCNLAPLHTRMQPRLPCSPARAWPPASLLADVWPGAAPDLHGGRPAGHRHPVWQERRPHDLPGAVGCAAQTRAERCLALQPPLLLFAAGGGCVRCAAWGSRLRQRGVRCCMPRTWT